MRDKFNKFMQGRYGVDDLSRFTMGAALVLIILAMFANIFSRTAGSTLDILGVAAIVYAYIRSFFQKYPAALCRKSEIPSDDVEVPFSLQ